MGKGSGCLHDINAADKYLNNIGVYCHKVRRYMMKVWRSSWDVILGSNVLICRGLTKSAAILLTTSSKALLGINNSCILICFYFTLVPGCIRQINISCRAADKPLFESAMDCSPDTYSLIELMLICRYQEYPGTSLQLFQGCLNLRQIKYMLEALEIS